MSDLTTDPTLELAVAPVDPDRDAALIHSWTSQERAVFWGLLDKDVDDIRDIYRWIDEQPHLAAYLVRHAGAPVALFQTYDPYVDEIGDHYDRQPGDVGVHLMLAPGRRPRGVTAAAIEAVVEHVWSDAAHHRVVLEPDADNHRSVALLRRVGAELGPVVQMPHKRAQFAFLDRAGWERARSGRG
ncbi:GNAT family N-acetyltransferase [Luteipulveratus flavus]|uniref:Lysine N-acyltransferase MbtK n=1 Tax=Luteipulveratus flavus TaxID=3031728 RepID=A0ABT6CBU9_9MICO|nr:GNAT family N-acetyltransferase [Luteipulveratus sp. YIM 133296]MDF8266374.1 GNAT family N-acetyltransferase [Luteipulveratus sp. YIM 133296]